ncbi:MAG: FG-GAP repeat domain-containing protein [Planctomycetota bacterium]
MSGAALAPVLALLIAATPGDPIVSHYSVAAPETKLALRDLDGDGRRDLIAIGLPGISWRRLGEDGRLADKDQSLFTWPSETVGWNLADLDGDGESEIVLIVDGTQALVVQPDAAGQLVAAPLVQTSAGFLPRGIRRVNFVRDVDGDGRPDLVLPGASRFHIFFNQAGGWSAPLSVSFQASIQVEAGDPLRVDSRISQEVKIPWFTLQDVDGDSLVDLVSETDDEVQFHIAKPTLPEQPTWRLDLAALKEGLERPARINLDDLLANVEPQVNWRVGDLDREAPHDLVLQQGGKVSLFLGGSLGPDLAHPDQVLKASGNVLYFLLRDVNQDTLPDLQLLRAETVSIGDAVRLLIVPGSLDFDVFAYHNEGGSFTRKPSVSTTLALRIPALLSFLDDLEQMQDDYNQRLEVPAQPAVLDGDGLANDIVDVRGDTLAVWQDRVPAGFQGSFVEKLSGFDADELLEEYALRKLDQLDDGGTVSIELKDIRKLLVTPGYDLRESLGSSEPGRSFPLDFAGAGAKLRIEDLDGDGRDDVLVIGRDAALKVQVQFFVMR